MSIPAEHGNGRSTRLPIRLLAEFERFFRCDLSSVAVDTSHLAEAANWLLGSSACTDGRTIFFRPAAYRPELPAGRWLIAHELAHVVQKRAGRSSASAPAPRHIYEREADGIADQFMCGELCAAVTPDPEQVFRCWGEAGHFYTTYFVAAAAGVETYLCALIAGRAQLADEVIELDAVKQGVLWTFADDHGDIDATGRPTFDPGRYEASMEVRQQARMVQRGLHCLNGNDAVDERKYRRSVLEKLSIEDFQFGFAIHAYGDSFSHTDGNGRMFDGPYGHMFAKPREEVEHEDSLFDRVMGCSVDHIHRRPGLFNTYVESLYDIFCVVAPKLERRRTKEQVARMASFLASLKSHDEQYKWFRHYIKNILGSCSSYWPEKFDPVFWETYRKARRNTDDLAHALTLPMLYGFARQWDRPDAALAQKARKNGRE